MLNSERFLRLGRGDEELTELGGKGEFSEFLTQMGEILTIILGDYGVEDVPVMVWQERAVVLFLGEILEKWRGVDVFF